MDNGDKKSESSAERRLKQGIAKGSISVRKVKYSVKGKNFKSTPIKTRLSIFKQQISDLAEESDNAFPSELIIGEEKIILANQGSSVIIDSHDDEGAALHIGGIRALSGAVAADLALEELGVCVDNITLTAERQEDIDFNETVVSEEGGYSTDSSVQKATIDAQEFYIKTKVNFETGGISLAVSKLRPNTYLGRQQGAHITAYVVFVTAILETVDERSIHEVPNLLGNVPKVF